MQFKYNMLGKYYRILAINHRITICAQFKSLALKNNLNRAVN